MEQLNRIELRGNVGNARVQTVGDNEVVHFSLATNYAYKGKDGTPVIETTWHSVVAWSGKGMPEFRKINKGSCVYVTGRLRSQKYTLSDGTERQAYEVIASRLSILETDEAPQPVIGL